MNITVRGEALVTAHQQLIHAFTEGDVESVLSLYSDDVVLMPANEPSIFGKAEAEEWLREYYHNFQIVDLVPHDRHVSLQGEAAIERWSYQVKIRPVAGGDPIRDDGRFLTVWQRSATAWLITQKMWNSVQPVGAGTRRFMSLLKQRLS
jgi:ketosteroid isomerase-like protein